MLGAYNGGSNHHVTGNISHASCYCMKYCPGSWEVCLVATRYPRNKWVRQDWFPRQSCNHLDQRELHWVYISHHAPASGKIECYNRVLKTTLRAMLAHSNVGTHLAKVTCLVNSWGSASWADPAQSNLQPTGEGDKVPVVHIKNMLGKTVRFILALGKGNPIYIVIMGLLLLKDLGALRG